MFRPILAALALTTGTAAQAATPCIPQREAEALFLALAPSVIGTTAATCATSLPPRALLRTRVAALTAKFAAESDDAWPLAKSALKRVIGPDADAMLESELAKPMLMSMVAPLLTKEIKPADCPNIDRVLMLMDPLPARNTAALAVTIIELAQRNKPPKSGRSLNLCPIDATAP